MFNFPTKIVRNVLYGNALGRRQAVRHRILVPAFGGSNPPAPARKKYIEKV